MLSNCTSPRLSFSIHNLQHTFHRNVFFQSEMHLATHKQCWVMVVIMLAIRSPMKEQYPHDTSTCQQENRYVQHHHCTNPCTLYKTTAYQCCSYAVANLEYLQKYKDNNIVASTSFYIWGVFSSECYTQGRVSK
jgi:hypothetical protein